MPSGNYSGGYNSGGSGSIGTQTGGLRSTSLSSSPMASRQGSSSPATRSGVGASSGSGMGGLASRQGSSSPASRSGVGASSGGGNAASASRQGSASPASRSGIGAAAGGGNAASRSSPTGARGPTGPQGQARSNFAGSGGMRAAPGLAARPSSTGLRGPTGPQGQARTNFAGNGISGLTHSAPVSTGNWMGAYGRPRQVNAQQRMRTDLNVALGAKQPNLNPVFGDALYRGLLDASRKGILSRQIGQYGLPFAYDEDTLGRTQEQAMQNLVNRTRRAQMFNGKLYKPDPNRVLTKAAGPYTSPHVFGLAADIAVEGPLRPYLQSPASLAKYGFETIPGDTPHIQLAGTRQLSKTKGLRSKYAMVDQGKPVSITRYAGMPSKPAQTASLGPIATPSRAPQTPAQTGLGLLSQAPAPVPTPRQRPTLVSNEAAKANAMPLSAQIAARGIPTPRFAAVPQPSAPTPYFGQEINAAMRQQAPYARQASPTVGSPPQVSGVPIGRGPRGLNPAAGPIANPDNPGIGRTLSDIQREIDASQKRTQQTSTRVHQLQERMGYQAPQAPDPVAALEAARQASQARTQAINARNHQLQERMNYQAPPAPVASNIMDQYRGMIDTIGTRPGMADMRTNIGMPQGDSIDVADASGMSVPSFDPRMRTEAPIDGLPAPPQPGQQWPQAKPKPTPPPAALTKPAPTYAPSLEAQRAMRLQEELNKFNAKPIDVEPSKNPQTNQIAGAAQTKEVQTPEQQAIESVIEGVVNKLGKFANSNYSKAVGKRNQEVTSKRIAMMGGNRIERMQSRLARALLKNKTAKSEKAAKKLAEVILAWNIQYTPA